MPESQFLIRAAIDLLEERGLLAGSLQAVDGALHRGVAAETAGFLGAGLDSRALQPGELFLAVAGEHADGRNFIPSALERGHWVLADVDPRQWNGRAASGGGILASPDPMAALSELGARWRQRRAVRTIGITGTNGKTTTKDLTAALLGSAGNTLATAGNLNNHLGVPLTLLSLRERHEFAVIEMGASARGEIASLSRMAAPQVGVITNASAAHLAEFGSLEGIIQGKGELLDALPGDGTAILNCESPGFEKWSERAHCPVVTLGRTAGDHRWRWLPAGWEGGTALELDGTLWPVPLPGEHNAANLAAAILAARALGLDDATLRRGLEQFSGSAHRGVLLELTGRLVLDDCYNANPSSMVAAARTLVTLPAGAGSRALAVIGTMAELGERSAELHRRTGAELLEAGLVGIVVVGSTAEPLARGFAAAGGRADTCADADDAADWLARNSVPGDRILVKGSRSAGLEKVIERLQAGFETKPGD